MAKHIQVNPTGSSLSATDSLTDTATALGNVSDESFETTTSQPSASTAESSQPHDAQRKSWLNQDELLKSVNQNLNQLPQSLKDLGTKAADQFNTLSTQQKIIGGALLVSGLSWLALRSKKSKSSSDIYGPKGESKWNSSNESVYRGASAGLHNSDTIYTENGF